MTESAEQTPRVEAPVPILRIFDEAKAREFYLDWLGFEAVFEHRFAPDAPLYMGIRLGACELHLSEHHGDACPGAAVRIGMQGLEAFHARLIARDYRHARPGIDTQPWGFREVRTCDPFGNRLIFCERMDDAPASAGI